MIYLRPSGIQKIHNYIIETQGGESGLLNKSMLDVAYERPRTFVYGHEPYDTLIAKASVLAYEIIVGHPFVDGNKRTAIASMLTMLSANLVFMVIPPYIVKYSIRAAKREINESQFTELIEPLCSSSLIGFLLKYFRCVWWTNRQLALFRQRILMGFWKKRMIDWYAAGDIETFNKTVTEWQQWQAQGYPKKGVPIPLKLEDFVEG